MATQDCTKSAWRPPYRDFCSSHAMIAACPMLVTKLNGGNFQWFNNTSEKQNGPVLLTDPDDGSVFGMGVPTCPICPGHSGRLECYEGCKYEVRLKAGEPDIEFGKKMYLEVAADGSFVGATVTPPVAPAVGISFGRAVIDIDHLKCDGTKLIVAPVGSICVTVMMCHCYVPQVF